MKVQFQENKEKNYFRRTRKNYQRTYRKYAGKITDAIRDEIEKTIGEEMANAFISEIEQFTGLLLISCSRRISK